MNYAVAIIAILLDLALGPFGWLMLLIALLLLPFLASHLPAALFLLGLAALAGLAGGTLFEAVNRVLEMLENRARNRRHARLRKSLQQALPPPKSGNIRPQPKHSMESPNGRL